jgi:flagellar hook-associated protein 1 FlgK
VAGLNHTLNVGAESLYATRQGVDTAGHNIANAQVDGYSRQRINLRQREPLQQRGLLIGNGAYVGNITRHHDQFVENQLTKAKQSMGRAEARAEGLKSIEVIYSPELNASVADEVTSFFNNLENLSNFPEDYTVRTSVVETGKNVAAAFRRVDMDLKAQRSGLNERIAQTTAETTDRLRQIADLNIKIQTAEAGMDQNANDMRDQRDRLVREVSDAIDIHYYEDQHGMMVVRGPSETTLVDAGNAGILTVARNEDNAGLFNVVITDWNGNMTRNVTEKLSGGTLAANVELRDKDLPNLIAKNNEMAYGFATNFNEVHRQGYGLKQYAEVQGRDFFRPPTALATAAQDIDLDDAVTTSNDAIAAASSQLAPGDNVVMNQLIKLKDAKLFAGQASLNEFYANYTGALGLDTLRADHIREASSIQVEDLNRRREAISGVSLDEEATNILKWQANFTASSKLITTIDEMYDTVLSLKR